MSIASWKKEFMPTKACDTSKKEAYDHVLRKWIGLRKENLRRHGLHSWYRTVWDRRVNQGMSIDYRSCAFCHHYFNTRGERKCNSCPLSKALGASCDALNNYTALSPYGEFLRNDNPEPMISAIIMTRYKITMEEVYANE